MDRVGECGEDSRDYQAGAWVLRASDRLSVCRGGVRMVESPETVTPASP